MKWACSVPGCGAVKVTGRPRLGWVKVEGKHHDGRKMPLWYCSWTCVFEMAVLEARELRDLQEA